LSSLIDRRIEFTKINVYDAELALTSWAEIEPGAVQKPEEQAAGSRCGQWGENYLAREPRRITDGSSKARKKSSARSAPQSFARRGNRIFELNAVPGGKLENGLCNLPLGLTSSPPGASPPPEPVAARRALSMILFADLPSSELSTTLDRHFRAQCECNSD